MVRPSLLFVGPYMGNRPGRTTAAGRVLADLLAEDGYPVRIAPTGLSRMARFAEVVTSLLTIRGSTRLQVLQVYSGMSFHLADVSSLISKALGYRMVMHVHGGAIPDLITANPRWASRVLRRGGAIVVPSPYLARSLSKIGLGPLVIPNPLAIGDYPHRERSCLQPRLLWMRAFHRIYNPEMAVRTLSSLRKSVPKASLVMAGPDKGYLAQVKNEVERLGLEDAVEFPGCVGGAVKSATFDSADIFLNTTHIDNTPVTVLEAWASGLPVVSTRVGGIPDMIEDGVSGLLVDDNDESSMSAAVLRLLDDHGLAHELSIHGREKAEGCDWSCVLPKWRALLGELSGTGE